MSVIISSGKHARSHWAASDSAATTRPGLLALGELGRAGRGTEVVEIEILDTDRDPVGPLDVDDLQCPWGIDQPQRESIVVTA
ncbi:hypothetical protein ACIBJI_19905 [Nocardia sp. NPDC050408]|uniref:hypothetical protein n=1 Tax=unclassified Nocardia TaxID=2637762 RepID=UPI003443F981